MKTITLYLSLLLSVTSWSQPGRIDSLLDAYQSRHQLNGVVLVAHKGKVIYKKAVGVADSKTGKPLTTGSKFLIGSLTKSFTAIAVMQLVEKRLLDLHKPVGHYLPRLNKEIGTALTLHLLLKQSSGLPVHLNRIIELKHADLTEDELVRLFDTVTLHMKPGTGYEYSNLNYQLAAVIVAKVSGLSYKQYIERYILLPLGMHHSGLERTTEIPDGKATGHEVKDEQFLEAGKNYMGYALGSGDIYTTAEDLLLLDQALYASSFLSEESKKLLFDGRPEEFGGYGYGFRVKAYSRPSAERPGGKLVRHGGTMIGYTCNMSRYLDDQLTIIILGNIRPFPVMEINDAIAEIILSL